MAFCEHCGAKLEEIDQFCSKCGAKVEKNISSIPLEQAVIRPARLREQCMAGAGAEKPKEYSEQEIQSGKLMGILSYLGIFVLIPLFVEKSNRFVRFHVNQGLILFAVQIFMIFINMVMLKFVSIPMFAIILLILQAIIYLWIGISSVIGIVNVLRGKASQIFPIGRIQILK